MIPLLGLFPQVKKHLRKVNAKARLAPTWMWLLGGPEKRLLVQTRRSATRSSGVLEEPLDWIELVLMLHLMVVHAVVVVVVVKVVGVQRDAVVAQPVLGGLGQRVKDPAGRPPLPLHELQDGRAVLMMGRSVFRRGDCLGRRGFVGQGAGDGRARGFSRYGRGGRRGGINFGRGLMLRAKQRGQGERLGLARVVVLKAGKKEDECNRGGRADTKVMVVGGWGRTGVVGLTGMGLMRLGFPKRTPLPPISLGSQVDFSCRAAQT